MNNWKETTLDEIAYIIMGQSPSSESYNLDGDGLPFYQGVTEFGDKYLCVKNFTNSPTKVIDAGSILFSVRAPVGRVNFTKNKCCIGRGNAGLMMKNGEQEFLYYLLKYLEKIILKNTTGTVFDSISGVELRKFPVSVPESKNEQKQIADILSSLDDKIELLREQNKTLEATAQTIFKEWFVNFNFPDENGKPYKNAGGKMIDSELGEIPEGWRVSKLGEIAFLKSGFAFKGEDFVGKSNTRVLKIKDLKGSGEVNLEDISFVNDNVAEQERVKYFKLDSGDIVLAMSGNTTGKIGIVPAYLDNLFLNQRVGKFFMKNNDYKNLLYLFLMSGDYETVILNMGYGSAQPNINPTQIENIDMILPVGDVLEKFKSAVDPMMEKNLINKSQIQTLSHLRDTLLPKLMNGEIEVNK
ncbi:MAG: restriction endonuclease subunit S [Candidatus Moraniibacteriota bacterium]